MTITGPRSPRQKPICSAPTPRSTNLKARKAAQHAAVAEAQSAIIATQADVDRTRDEAVRQQALLATTYGTRQKVEQADADEKRLVATLASNQAELDAQQRQMAVLDTQELQVRAEDKAKQADARSGENQSRLYPDRGADRRRRQRARRAHRPVRPCRERR